MEIKGIDISKYQAHTSGQTKINFQQLKREGYEFVMIRAGYGKVKSQKDKAFESHYAGAKAAGLHIGAYHYTYAVNVAEAKQETACFLEWIKGKQLDYPVAFDIEDNSLLKGLTTAQRTEIALTWMQIVENAGYYVMLYVNPSWAKNYLDMDKLSHFDIWLACYTTEARRKQLYPKNNFGIWQYTSTLQLPSAYVAGKNLDGDIAYKDYASIIKSKGLNGYKKTVVTPTPTPAPKPTEPQYAPEVVEDEVTETIEDEDKTGELHIGDKITLRTGATYADGKPIPFWIAKGNPLYVRKVLMFGEQVSIATSNIGPIVGTVKRSDIIAVQ